MAIKRQQIVDALKSAIQGITVANGYHTDIGLHTSIWLAEPNTVYDPSELPVANIRDISDVIVRANIPFDDHEMDVNVDLIFSSGQTTDAAVRQGIYDVYRKIGTDPTLGGLAINTMISSDEMILDQSERIVGGATISLSVQFRTSNYQES